LEEAQPDADGADADPDREGPRRPGDDLTGCGDAVDLRHPDVHEDNVGPQLFDTVNRLTAGSRLADRVGGEQLAGDGR